jgi:hypothetical protein
MTPLVTLIALAAALFMPQDNGGWKAKRLAIVLQHSGAQRATGAGWISMITRILAMRPEKSEVALIGFDRDFEQLDNARFKRHAVVLQTFSNDADELSGAVRDIVFHGPSPVWDALMIALGDGKPESTPERILLFSNGMDNASATTFDALEAAASKAKVPVICVYIPNDPPQGGDARLKKIAKASGGKFIDTRQPGAWEQLTGSL